jgi:phage/plasmid-associated DNA primase
MKEYSSYFFNKNNDVKLSKQEEEEFLKKIKGMTKMKREVGNSSFISGVIAQIQSILTKPNEFIDNFDNNPNLFAFSDGKCIDLLNGGKVREIVKEDFIITTTGYAYPERNEIFIKKMNDIINSLSDDPEQIKSIKSLLTLGLWGENQNEIFAQLTGSGGNGKGLLDTGTKKVYGKYYQSINSNQLTDYEKDNQRANSELASCRFARVVMATEPEDSKNGKSTTLKVPTLKKWTGRDIITTRFLHKDCFSYTAKFTLMMQLNDLLDLSTNDEAIKRRMKVIELPFKFVENKCQPLGENEKYRDESLKSLISTDEYRNAFFFILLDTWLENNGKFYESEKVKSYTNDFFENQNPVKLWFNQHYEFDRDNKISSIDMYNQFKIDDYNSTLTLTAFGRLLKECCKCEKKRTGLIYFCKRKLFENNDDRFNGVPL